MPERVRDGDNRIGRAESWKKGEYRERERGEGEGGRERGRRG